MNADDVRYKCSALRDTEDGFISHLKDIIREFAVGNAIKNNKILIDEKDMELVIKLAIEKVSVELNPPEPKIDYGCGRYPKRCRNFDYDIKG